MVFPTLHAHIVGLLKGEHTVKEFAEHYCVDLTKPTPQPE